MDAKKIIVNGIPVDLVMEPEDGSITTPKIVNGAVTKDKLSDALVAEMAAETSRATEAERQLLAAVTEEVARAAAAEAALGGRINERYMKPGTGIPKSDLSEDALAVMHPVTYAELKALRDGGELQPGHWYRLTDYQCVTTQAGTQAVNHPFDILIRADSASVLNENCYAALHEGDTYFSAEHLQSWRLKYTIDNDRYCWGGFVHGKRIYGASIGAYMERAAAADQPVVYGKAWALPEAWAQMLGVQYVYTKDETLYDWSDYLSAIPTDTIIPDYAYRLLDLGGGVVVNACTAEGKGVIYEMTDEYGNKMGFDFKNIQILTKVDENGHYDKDGDEVYAYTFNIATPMGMLDLSNDFQGFHAKNTVVTPSGIISRQAWLVSLADAPTITINDNTFGALCYGNTFGAECYGNNFGALCYGNTFGATCSGNTFGAECNRNNFGALCYGNNFGALCYGNTFGALCYGNTFGAECYGNNFGAECNRNNFGALCYGNNFGALCYGNTFGVTCYGNTFGAECNRNNFGANCSGNNFGANCNRNTFGANCSGNTFGADCSGNTFGAVTQENDFGNSFGLYYSRINGYFRNNAISYAISQLAYVEFGAIENTEIEVSKPDGWGPNWIVQKNSQGQIKQCYLGDLIQ